MERWITGEIKEKVLIHAETVNLELETADHKGIIIRKMCPLNQDGLCMLYNRRPLICRLHGIPHELNRPGKGILNGPGCDEFETRCGSKSDSRLDRTPFYIQMAQLEKELRSELQFQGKIKQTIAQMLVTGKVIPCNHG